MFKQFFNCSNKLNFLESDYVPHISIADLKEAMAENNFEVRNEKLSKLRQHLDSVVEEGCWDIDDVFRDEDFTDNATFQCVVYYLAG